MGGRNDLLPCYSEKTKLEKIGMVSFNKPTVERPRKMWKQKSPM